MRLWKLLSFAGAFWVCASVLLSRPPGVAMPVAYAATNDDGKLDNDLAAVLSAAGFTGNIEQTFHQRLEANLGRPINPKLANLGRLLWFDKIHSLHHDNTCGGCHPPTKGFGDTQPIPIREQKNKPGGPPPPRARKQRRSPL